MKTANLEQTIDSGFTQTDNLYGATLITATGEEIPITEQMIQHSFEVLIDAWEKQHSKP